MATTTKAPAEFMALHHALLDLEVNGDRTPCQRDPEPYHSDAPGERAEAAEACGSCPVITACATYADAAGERWGVWAGIDRTKTTTKRKGD